MSQRTLDVVLFGEEVAIDHAPGAGGYALVGLRLAMAWVFLQAGLTKLFAPDGWSASGYLENAIPAGNPLAGVWASLAGVPLVDPLVVWGEILIGTALLLGAAVRVAAFFGGLQLFLYWLSSLQGGPLAGFPVENGYLVTNHVVYGLILFGLAAFGAGRVLGVDGVLASTGVVDERPGLRRLLG